MAPLCPGSALQLHVCRLVLTNRCHLTCLVLHSARFWSYVVNGILDLPGTIPYRLVKPTAESGFAVGTHTHTSKRKVLPCFRNFVT